MWVNNDNNSGLYKLYKRNVYLYFMSLFIKGIIEDVCLLEKNYVS